MKTFFRFARSAIRVDHRFTYEQAEQWVAAEERRRPPRRLRIELAIRRGRPVR